MRCLPRSDKGQRGTGTAGSMTTLGWLMKTQRRSDMSSGAYVIAADAAAAARTSTRTCSVSSALSSAKAGVVFTE